jgi:hypothetical protein
MKTLTPEEHREAKRLAMQRIYSLKNYLNIRGYDKPFDKRTRIGREANRLMKVMQLTADEKLRLLQLRRSRAKTEEPTNYLTDPITLDYLRNKRQGRCEVVFKQDGTAFIRWNNGRNHWAKNGRQYNILTAINKYVKA